MTDIEIWLRLWEIYWFDCVWGLGLTPDMIAWCTGGWVV